MATKFVPIIPQFPGDFTCTVEQHGPDTVTMRWRRGGNSVICGSSAYSGCEGINGIFEAWLDGMESPEPMSKDQINAHLKQTYWPAECAKYN